MKSRLIAAALCFCSLTPLGTLASDSAAAPLTPIAASTFHATWAPGTKSPLPAWFQKKCTGESRAEYTPLTDGQVQVINRCRLENGTMNEAVGTAEQVGGADFRRSSEVHFAPAWLSFLPFVWGNYWVIDLDDAYQLVAVSEPTRYLWVLSRTRQVDQKPDALLERLARKGFDLSKLQLTRQ